MAGTPGAPGAPVRPPRAIRRGFAGFRSPRGSPRDPPRIKPKFRQSRRFSGGGRGRSNMYRHRYPGAGRNRRFTGVWWAPAGKEVPVPVDSRSNGRTVELSSSRGTLPKPNKTRKFISERVFYVLFSTEAQVRMRSSARAAAGRPPARPSERQNG